MSWVCLSGNTGPVVSVPLSREKSFTEETFHGNEEESKKEKEALIAGEMKLSHATNFTGLLREAPLKRLFRSQVRVGGVSLSWLGARYSTAMVRISNQFVIACFLCVLVSLGWSKDGAPAVVGTWEGESKCTVPGSPCRDEHVVYQISADKHTSGKLAMSAYKVVNGEQEFMGTLECVYNAEQASLSCSANTPKKDDWEFTVSGDTMTGTLTLGDEKTLYRRVHVRKR